MKHISGFLFSPQNTEMCIVHFNFNCMPGSVTTPDNTTLNLYFNPLFKTGRWEARLVPMIASVPMPAGAAIYAVKDGTHTIVTSVADSFKGILLEKIAAADADYATSKKMKLVAVPLESSAEAEFYVGSGTFTSADVGKSVAFVDSTGLAVDTAGTHARITKYLKSTRGVCIFNQAIT